MQFFFIYFVIHVYIARCKINMSLTVPVFLPNSFHQNGNFITLAIILIRKQGVNFRLINHLIVHNSFEVLKNGVKFIQHLPRCLNLLLLTYFFVFMT